MKPPPPYPRIPHLASPPSCEGDDLIVPSPNRDSWLHEPITVEEKLDGANVALWFDDAGALQVAGRAGVGAMDRSHQLGRLRAWAAEHTPRLLGLLQGDLALYGEWLWLTHTIHYDRLPDLLVVIDLWSPTGFVPVDERDPRCLGAGMAVPPRLFQGVLGSLDPLWRFVGESAYRDGPAEGVVLRKAGTADDGRRSKLLAPGFVRRRDTEWAGRRQHNLVSQRAAHT